MTIDRYHIYGDNIVECERTIGLIRGALAGIAEIEQPPIGSITCPMYSFKKNGSEARLEFVLFPGFGRWNYDILSLVRQMGGGLREAADTIITRLTPNSEEPLLALEYCGALPAGNQAWQRSGRAYSFGRACIPYLYVAELGGYELDSSRNRKAARTPNPAVPFSYAAYSSTKPASTYQVFVPAPGADAKAKAQFSEVYGLGEMISMLRACLLGESFQEAANELGKKALRFVGIKASSSRSADTLRADQWEEAYRVVTEKRDFLDYVSNSAPIAWSKTAYIDGLTPTAAALMKVAASYAKGLTSSKLPLCVVPKEKVSHFVKALQEIYREPLPAEFTSWLARERNLAICWVMGFKPRGDDARPDRGLPPFARMLIGEHADLLTVVYGPASSATWEVLDGNPGGLLANGLWESILDASDAVLADSSTDRVRRRGYLRSHWEAVAASKTLVHGVTLPAPRQLGEQDVDTALHVLLVHYGPPNIFEGLCNPPGGDWSGLSLVTVNGQVELRWLTLPRVSANGEKRPDHVFQISLPDQKPIVLIVESKDLASQTEDNIGPRLIGYVRELINTTASIERSVGSESWIHSERKCDSNAYEMCTAIAFQGGGGTDHGALTRKANVDISLAFDFSSDGAICRIRGSGSTKLGKEILLMLTTIHSPNKNISVEMVV